MSLPNALFKMPCYACSHHSVHKLTSYLAMESTIEMTKQRSHKPRIQLVEHIQAHPRTEANLQSHQDGNIEILAKALKKSESRLSLVRSNYRGRPKQHVESAPLTQSRLCSKGPCHCNSSVLQSLG